MQAVELGDLQLSASPSTGTTGTTVTVAAARAGMRVLVTYCHIAKGAGTSITASFGGTLIVAQELAVTGFSFTAGVNPGFTQVQSPIIGPVNTDFRVVTVGTAWYAAMFTYIPG